jgi:hypothetical protein
MSAFHKYPDEPPRGNCEFNASDHYVVALKCP